jgi:hypothetical protein
MKWLVIAALVLGCSGKKARPAHEPPERITEFVWIDRLPKHEKEFFHGLFLLRGVPIGFFQKASAYQIFAERFDVLRDGAKLDLRFPQSGKKAQVTYRIERCDAPEPFTDLCLELSKQPWQGPRRYYALELERARRSERFRPLVEPALSRTR